MTGRTNHADSPQFSSVAALFGFAASLSTFLLSDRSSGFSRTDSAYRKIRLNLLAQPSLLHLFVVTNLVPSSDSCLSSTHNGLLFLLTRPSVDSRHASRSFKELPLLVRPPGHTRCTLTLSQRLDALIHMSFCRPIASYYQLWGSCGFMLFVRLNMLLPTLRATGQITIPLHAGLRPSKFFPRQQLSIVSDSLGPLAVSV
jgi:hypothetical protein